MLKLAGPAMGLGEKDLFDKSKQGKEEKVLFYSFPGLILS